MAGLNPSLETKPKRSVRPRLALGLPLVAFLWVVPILAQDSIESAALEASLKPFAWSKPEQKSPETAVAAVPAAPMPPLSVPTPQPPEAEPAMDEPAAPKVIAETPEPVAVYRTVERPRTLPLPQPPSPPPVPSLEAPPLTGAWAGKASPTVDMIRRQVRAEVDSRPRMTPNPTPSWQELYRLGPGDSLNFSMYDREDLERASVPIAPDGTVSYLQAISIPALGRTIPELRKAIEASLSKYHRNPKVIVTPAIIGSKRFTIIGRVREPGSYLLNRPTTILEGLAAARGIEVGSVRRYATELADLERSFVVRSGHKLDVNLADLYYRGQLSQNAYLEPNDYIYIASNLENEVYILGHVNNPGRYKMATPLTVTRAITEAGGYDRQAYKARVLLVRGSIHNPETFVIDIRDVLHGRKPDLVLQNRDILFIDERPFQVAERALDSAIFTFVQTVTTESINNSFLDLSIPTGPPSIETLEVDTLEADILRATTP